MTDETEITTPSFRTKALNVWQRFYAWAKLHLGIVIPAVAYIAGMATPTIVRWLVT